MTDQPQTPERPDPEALKAQKRRNVWLALALFGFVILLGAVTMLRLGEAATDPEGGLYWSLD
ncbi:MAG: hypothetical protein AAFX03_05935 [Pseudomonadota bacterium]